MLTPERDLLVVREKFGVGGREPTLKLPGGALLAGEHLGQAVEREVFEETGVRAEFESIACFRQWHGYRYGKSDIYFVGKLRPLSKEITMQTAEIQECLWMSVDDFISSENISNFNKQIVRAALETDGIVQSFIEGVAVRKAENILCLNTWLTVPVYYRFPDISLHRRNILELYSFSLDKTV